MAKSTKVSLGGREYTITQKPMGATARWREKLRTSRVMMIMESLDHVIGRVRSIVQDMNSGGLSNIDAGDAFGIAAILPAVTNGLLYSVDEVWALVWEFEPAIEADREWLEEHAYDEEGVSAFLEVLKFNFPIMALSDLVNGRRAPATPTNSPIRNGGNGLSPSGPKRKNVQTSSLTATSDGDGGNGENKP